MKSIYRLSIYCLGLLIAISSCETTDLDITEDPNALTENQASTDLFINSVQRDFGRLIAEIEDEASEASRILQFNDGTYLEHFTSTNNFDTQWQDAYQGILQDIRTMTPLAEDADQAYHIAMGKVIEAYVITSLVDLFGDVPYREALNAAETTNPNVTPGADIYSDALTLLDEAIVAFKRDDVTTTPALDMFYGGDWENWVKAANSIKLKLLVTTRLVDGSAAAQFDAIIAGGEYIQENSEDFQFSWGSSVTNPDSRHPRYAIQYTPSGIATGYMSNWLMDYMLNDKRGNGNITYEGGDPRMQYYFYRQSSAISTNPNDIMCIIENAAPHGQTDPIFCVIPNNEGYWGRSHGNNRGIPPDTQRRTAYGVYPIGGFFDDNSFKIIASITLGAGGAGITPMMLSAWVDFYQAEMALAAGDNASAQAFIESGTAKHIAKVRTFGPRDASADLTEAPDPANDVLFVQEVGEQFAAASATDKWNVLGREFFVSLFGNGIDGYNFYRRTGFPETQIHFIGNEGNYFRSFQYPSFFVNRNSSTEQKPNVEVPVFWDQGVTLMSN